MAPKKSLAERFADLDKPVKDYDPENEAPEDEESDESDVDVDQEERATTEHYEAVGKSKLRQKQGVSLGPKYRGAVVSRSALQESDEDEYEEDEVEDEEVGKDSDFDGSDSSEYDDPDEADLERDHVEEDFDIDSDEAFGESDEEKFQGFSFAGSSKNKSRAGEKGKQKAQQGGKGKRPIAADFYTDSEELDEHGSEELNSSEEESELGQNGVHLSGDKGASEEGSQGDESGEDDEDNEDEDDEEESPESDEDSERIELRKLMGGGQKAIASTVAQAVRADAEKGAAVRQQRRAFDSILNLRIRLQKALVAANSFGALEPGQEPDKEPYQAAEEAAIKLWNTLDKFRETLVPESKTTAGEKRKREIGPEDGGREIWDSLVAADRRAMPYRRKVLDKWSSRVRNSAVSATTRKLKSAPTQTLVAVLDDHLLNADRLVKRAHTPRSCAPVQAAKKVEEDPSIYDDADFYQMLLKELVDQRSTDMTAPGTSVTTVRWAAIKEAKTRKQVDRRASKGRKLRFTVHEKLQNFMAPEDRRTWEQDAIDRFVGTLFGQKLDLKDDADEDEEMGGVGIEEGFKLFQSR
ncbi:TRAUB-domain-containing protein [Thozetella sp. PMI_491]|nr:TRAUB-domain-containing protein [Thozetella sp. PMI_491]